jgi:hypothetical protein
MRRENERKRKKRGLSYPEVGLGQKRDQCLRERRGRRIHGTRRNKENRRLIKEKGNELHELDSRSH